MGGIIIVRFNLLDSVCVCVCCYDWEGGRWRERGGDRVVRNKGKEEESKGSRRDRELRK